MEDEDFEDTETKTWIGKDVPILVTIPSNFKQEPTFGCDPNPRDLVSSLSVGLETLATRNKDQWKMNFVQNETTMKDSLARILEALNQRNCVGIETKDNSCENNSAQVLQLHTSTH